MTEHENSNEAGETIALDKFLKLANLVGSGGEAKHLIRSGAVSVNGEEESRRGRKLRDGDVVNVNGEDYVIEATPNEDA
jgi:ribosome-associated protein